MWAGDARIRILMTVSISGSSPSWHRSCHLTRSCFTPPSVERQCHLRRAARAGLGMPAHILSIKLRLGIMRKGVPVLTQNDKQVKNGSFRKNWRIHFGSCSRDPRFAFYTHHMGWIHIRHYSVFHPEHLNIEPSLTAFPNEKPSQPSLEPLLKYKNVKCSECMIA